MESREETIRVKQETNDTWYDANEDDDFDSVDSCEAENLSFHEPSTSNVNEATALHENLGDETFIEYECKDFKPELKSLSTSICKTEHQSCVPAVKTGNQAQTSSLGEKSSTILIKKERKFDKDSLCRNTSQEKSPLNTRINSTRKKIKSHECAICRKSFDYQSYLKRHMTVHTGKKPFKCEICCKSFSQKINLKSHMTAVHDRSKFFECDVCHQSFKYFQMLKNHEKAIHIRSEFLKCKICLKSFSSKSNLNIHIDAVHVRIKPFECEICHNSFSRKDHLINHINSVHDQNKPFKCEICHKSYYRKGILNAHINAVHYRSKPFECDFCHKTSSEKGNLRRHITSVHNRSKL
uniref:C2H2-type domain-containing protein n=1 Tax=Trichogramma kaykai TaxID=54128 RepID=A0ABD2WTZ7_9HYME